MIISTFVCCWRIGMKLFKMEALDPPSQGSVCSI